MGRATGRWSIQLTQRHHRDDGTASGVAVVSLDPVVLSQALGDEGASPGHLVVVRRLSDGALIARSRDTERHLSRRPEPNHPAVVAARERPSGRLRYASRADGREVLASYRVPPGVPVVVQAVHDVTHALAGFRRVALAVWFGVGAAVLGGLSAGLAWVRGRRLAAAQRHDRAQAALMDTITASMAQGLAAWDAEGRLLACNARYESMLELPPGLAVPGRHYHDIARHLAGRGEYGAGDAETLARQRFALVAGADGLRETRTRRNGAVLDIEGRALPGGGFVVTYTDVTEAHAAARALQESEARFRLLAEHSGDVVALTGMDGLRAYVSPASEHVLGWHPAELVGRNVRDFMHPEDMAWFEAGLSGMQHGNGAATATYRHRRPDGSWMWVEVHARVHSMVEGSPAGYVAVIRDASERKRAEAEILAAYERMQAMASTDALTGIANRRRFEEVLETEWARCAREQQPLSVLLMDVDHFKRFNDLYGHPEGDACLRSVADALAGVAQRPGDLAARIGGEEFAMLLPQTEAVGAAEVAERLRSAVVGLGIPHDGNAGIRVVTASIGVATVYPGTAAGGRERDALLSLADAALYEAKNGGRNRVRHAAEAARPAALPA